MLKPSSASEMYETDAGEVQLVAGDFFGALDKPEAQILGYISQNCLNAKKDAKILAAAKKLRVKECRKIMKRRQHDKETA